eukprot:2964165-Rhodomonas_salina.1
MNCSLSVRFGSTLEAGPVILSNGPGDSRTRRNQTQATGALRNILNKTNNLKRKQNHSPAASIAGSSRGTQREAEQQSTSQRRKAEVRAWGESGSPRKGTGALERAVSGAEEVGEEREAWSVQCLLLQRAQRRSAA